MKKQLPLALVAVLFVVTLGLLWSRIHTLENEVKSLREQVKSDAVIMPLRNAEAIHAHQAEVNDTQKEEGVTRPFKLLTPARQNDHTDRATNVGVPWEVERAMIGGAHENAVPRNEEIQLERKVDTPDSIQKLLDAK